MLSKMSEYSPKLKVFMIVAAFVSIFSLSAVPALADIGPITYNSEKVTFNLPGSEPASPSPVIWEMTLWHKGIMEGRETGTQGQQLNIWVPSVDGCNFQIDARNLTLSPGVITYSTRTIIPDCGQSDR